MKTSDLIGPALGGGEEFDKHPIGHPAHFSPSVNWAQGGPIIERELIGLNAQYDGQWVAHSVGNRVCVYGPTPLITAMRCYCCATLGDDIVIPEGVMPAAKQLAGQIFGRLRVIERKGIRNGRVTWLCLCECGNTHETVSHALTSGHAKSCGCWRAERNAATPEKHGHASRVQGLSPTYQSWRAMWTRCTNPHVKSYKNYGARGVTICPRWADFGNFLADMGERPEGKTLDRRNPSGNYEPNNCRWATRQEQAMNTRKHASKLGDEVDIPEELK